MYVTWSSLFLLLLCCAFDQLTAVINRLRSIQINVREHLICCMLACQLTRLLETVIFDAFFPPQY